MANPSHCEKVKKYAQTQEDYYFDRKSARLDKKEIARHLSAFSNASGGSLVIGIENDGEVTGFKRSGARKIEDFEQAAISDCEPSPKVKPKRLDVINSKNEEDVVLELNIEPSVDHVVKRRSDGAVFLRQNGSSNTLDHEQILALEYDKNQRCFEDEIIAGSSIADIDEAALDLYKNSIGASSSNEKVLESRGYLFNGHLTNAGVLLFATNPGKYLPCSRIRFLRFEGTEMHTGQRLNVVKDLTFEGPLATIIPTVRTAVQSQLREFQFLNDDGVFVTVPEYPEFAWLEGIINALTHRNYALSGEYIRISMFDDRLEIVSPGKLPNIVTLDNMLNTRYSRNPRLARALSEIGWVRELNEGVKRIYDEMRLLYLKEPQFDEPNDMSVRLVLENNIIARALRGSESFNNYLNDKTADLSEDEITTMQYVFSNGTITTRELATLIHKGSSYSSRLLKKLQEKNLLAWHGNSKNDPSQFYSLVSK